MRMALAAILSALLCGCTDNMLRDIPDGAPATSNVYCVVVGMENSARFGECPGCRKDSSQIDELLRKRFGYSTVLLQSEKATRQAVAEAMATAVKSTPTNGLFILYYSGHGGQEKLPGWGTSEPEGSDSEDEYLCLYDSYLLDDEIWKMVSKCRGRVFMCFDACHSRTMYRSVASDISLRSGKAIPLSAHTVYSRGFRFRQRAVPLASDSVRMLCWSGCEEAEYSFGSSRGGKMTNAIISHWKRGIGYEELWPMVYREVNAVQPTQHPCSTQLGSGFKKAEAFR